MGQGGERGVSHSGLEDLSVFMAGRCGYDLKPVEVATDIQY